MLQVRMHVAGRCKMGISFWPSFRFKAPDREAEVRPALINMMGVANSTAAHWKVKNPHAMPCHPCAQMQ